MRRVIGVVVMIVAAAAGRAAAQSSDTRALAEQLFQQARDLAKANKWAEACPKFEASLRYDPALGTRLNLAICYERTGKLASAWALYRESVDLANKAGDSKRRDYARQQTAALEPRLPRLTVEAASPRPAGLVVKRGATRIEASALGSALYVDPGVYEVTASAPGFETFTRTVTLAEGKSITLAIPKLKEAAATAAVEAPRGEPAGGARTDGARTDGARTDGARPDGARPDGGGREGDARAGRGQPSGGKPEGGAQPDGSSERAAPAAVSSKRRYLAFGITGAGVAAAGVGLLFGASARSSYRDAKALCGSDLVCAPADFTEGKQLIRDARSSATIATVLVAAGGAAIIAGAVVYFTSPRARERTARLVPVTHDRGAGLAVIGRF